MRARATSHLRRLYFFMSTKHSIAVLLAAIAIVVTGAANAGPAETAEAELRLAREAAGGVAWDRAGAVVMTGADHVKGVDTHWEQVVDLATGRTRESRDFGLFKTVEIWDGRTRWSKGRSGGVHPINSAFAQMTNITDAWLAKRGYLKPNALGAHLETLGQGGENGAAFVVVLATPPHGRPVELWFDKKTSLLAQTVQELPQTIRTTRYDDHRATGGIVLPFKIVEDEGSAQNADNIHVDHVEFSRTIDSDFRAPQQPTDFTVGNNKTVVPVEIDGFIAIQAKLNGKGPFSFILDTGGRATLTPEAAKALGLESVGGGQASGAGEAVRDFQFATVNRLDIGGMTMRSVPFGIVPLDFDTVERGNKAPFAGILGLELFERFAVRIDYPRQEVTLQPLATYRHHGSGASVPIVFEEDMPLFAASINRQSGDVALDTGFPEPLTVQGKWATRHGLKEQLRGLELRGFGGVGGSFTLWASRADIQFANFAFPGVVSYYAEDKNGSLSSRSSAGILGNSVLSNFTLDLDYAHGQIWLDGKKAYSREAFDRVGITVEKEDAREFKVGSVIRGGPADVSGLEVGDAITAVDGRPASDLSGWDFGRLVRRPVATKMTLTVARDGKSRDVEVLLRELLP